MAAGSSPTAAVSGCIGPRGDGYQPGQAMGGDDAMCAHLPQAPALPEALAAAWRGVTAPA